MSATVRRSFFLWGSGALIVSALEYPLLLALTRLMGVIPQPYPSLGLTHGSRGDVYANLALPAVGIVYVLVWVCFLAISGTALGREIRVSLWTGSWLILVGALLHFVLHYTAPWLLVVTDSLRLTASASSAPPPYLNVFMLPTGRFLELPLLVCLVFGFTYARHRHRERESPADTLSRPVHLPNRG